MTPSHHEQNAARAVEPAMTGCTRPTACLSCYLVCQTRLANLCFSFLQEGDITEKGYRSSPAPACPLPRDPQANF